VNSRGRYSNVRKVRHKDGTLLDSGAEGQRYCQLLLLLKAGVIKNLEVHPRYALMLHGKEIKKRSERYPNGRQVYYVADFTYLDIENKVRVIEDVKMQSGHRTEVYKLKKAIMESMSYTITEV